VYFFEKFEERSNAGSAEESLPVPTV
jgi:hypothetical protein